MLRSRPRVLDPGEEHRDVTSYAKGYQYKVFLAPPLAAASEKEIYRLLMELTRALLHDVAASGSQNPLRFVHDYRRYQAEICLNTHGEPWFLLDETHDRYDA